MSKKIWILLFFLLGNSMLLLAQHCHIGDVITNPDGSQGVVFYVNPQGTGGWAVALNDLSSGCPWGEATDTDLADYNNTLDLLMKELDGKENTRKIRTIQNANPSFAAGMVDFENGWYLPSAGQLRILYSNLPLIQSVLLSNMGTSLSHDYKYWSSTEKTTSAYVVNPNMPSSGLTNGGVFATRTKTELNAVRPICDFSIFQWADGSVADSIVVNPTETTTYSVTVMEGGACPFTEEIEILVNHGESEVIDTTVCGNFTWHGTTYTLSGLYTHENTEGGDCTGFDTLYLTIIDAPTVNIVTDEEEVCEGDEVVLQAVVEQASIGDILCTDGTFVHPADWSSSDGKTPKGIIFYVDGTGNHGWALGLEEWQSVVWNATATLVQGLTNRATSREAIQDIDGLGNTLAIRKGSNATQFPAAFKMDISQGWYLPALGQLRYMYAHLYSINNSLNIIGQNKIPVNSRWLYWSSTQKDAQQKWEMGFKGNVLLNDGTSSSSTDGATTAPTNIKVRAVCSF